MADRQALTELRNNPEIIMGAADKEGRIGIMEANYYRAKRLIHMEDAESHHQPSE